MFDHKWLSEVRPIEALALEGAIGRDSADGDGAVGNQHAGQHEATQF